MTQLDRTQQDLKIHLCSDLEQILQLRPHIMGADSRTRPNPFLLTLRAEREAIDPSHLLAGRDPKYLPTPTQLATGQAPQGVRSRSIRSALRGQVQHWIEQIARQRGVTISIRPVPSAPIWGGWVTWTTFQIGMEGRGRFDYCRVAGTAMGTRLFDSPLEGEVWLQVDQAEDLQGRRFGWRARIGREGTLPLPPPSPLIQIDPPVEPIGLPRFHVLRIRTPQPLWVVCGGSPPLFHQGGESIWSAVLYGEEIETLTRICEEWGGTVEVDPEGESVEPLSVPNQV